MDFQLDFLHQRTSEGVRRAQAAGKQVGRKEGTKIIVKKSEPIKALIKKYSKDFDGNLNDKEVMAILKSKTITIISKDDAGQEIVREQSAKLARNTYYKYKTELRQTY